MAQTFSFSPLSLNLPESRISVDFTTFDMQSKPHSRPLRTSKPQPQLPQHDTVPRRALVRPAPLPEVIEEPEPARSVLSRQSSRRWPWNRTSPANSERSDSPIAPLSRTSSSASIGSAASKTSEASTVVSSVFSNAQSTSTARTSHSSLPCANTLETCQEEPLNLTTLPLSLLEQILSSALCLPLTVSIGPQNSENRHMQHRYNRAGLDYIDVQLILKHPLFMISHHMREVALDVLHRKCDFVIDLHRIYHTRVSSTIDDNLKKHYKFWTGEPPQMVRSTLRNLSKIHVRLPVPSCDSSGHRGRDEEDWIDGSDGKGGGGWKIKSLKREQDDAVGVEKCLESIMALVRAESVNGPESRGRSSSLSRTSSLRKRSLSRLRSKSRERQHLGRAPLRDSTGAASEKIEGTRQPLKRVEIVLVKRNPYAMVLPQTLSLIKILRSSPVSGFTKYYFELEAQKILWATKYRKRWQGFEPDGSRLLDDLQHLSVAPRPVEPIRTPTEFRFVNVNRTGTLQLSDTAMTKDPFVLERPLSADKTHIVQPLPSNAAVRRKPLAWTRKKTHKRKDSFALMMDEGMDEIGSSGTTTNGHNNPPTVDELKKIAEDIKNGLY